MISMDGEYNRIETLNGIYAYDEWDKLLRY